MLNHIDDVIITKKVFANPFVQGKIEKPELDIEGEISIENLYKFYDKVYLLLPLEQIDIELNSATIDEDNFKKIQQSLIVLPKKIKIMRIPILYEWGKCINKRYLDKCHLGSLDYDSLPEKVLILPLFIFPYDQMISFLELFKNKDWLDELILNFKLAEFLKISTNYAEIKNQLEYTPVTYWSKENNCKINGSKRFQMRNFRWQMLRSNSNSDKLKTVDELKKYNLKDDNYLSIFFKTYGNLDSKFGTIDFKLHSLPKVNKNFTSEQFNDFFSSLKNHQKFNLFNSILVSPEYCHLIMKNEEIWNIMEPMIKKSLPLYRYLLFYTYLSLYLQENIKKTYLKQEDSSIIPIGVACKLPNFPYLQSEQNSHPAIAAGQLIQNRLYTKNNFYGLSCMSSATGDEFKLSNFEEFQQRLNIFMTGNSIKNIFTQVNFKNIHLTGSMIPACALRKHPLVNNFVGVIPPNVDNFDYLYHRYFSEFYSESDIDVLFTINDPFKFYQRVLEFKRQLEEGINLYEPSEINLKVKNVRKGYLRFNYAFVTKTLLPYWRKEGIEKTVQEVLTSLDEEETKKLFIPFYKEKIKYYYQRIQEEYSKKEKEELKDKYSHIFEPISMDLIILDHYEQVNKKKMKVEDMEFSEEEKDYDGEPFFDARESFKYNLSHPTLNHHFECFSIPFEDPWSCINKFHLGQVRGYYNGKNVYYTISAIMALQTKLSPDYRIMFGSKDPGEILNKYRMRGFGCILNDNELSQLIKYSEKVPFWKNLYMIDSKNKNSLLEFSKELGLSSSLFQPRTLNSDHYKNSQIFVTPEYSIPNAKYITSNNQLKVELEQILNSNIINQKYLSPEGYPIPLKKWLLDGAWELFEMDKMFAF